MPSPWAPINELHEIIGWGAVFLACGLALVMGGKIERTAGLIGLADAFGLLVLTLVFSRYDRSILAEVKAAGILVAYGAMVVRWPAPWLVLMTALQAFAVLLHLSTFIDRTILSSVNGLLLNGVGWAMLVLLAAATIVQRFSQRDRRRVATT